MATPVAIVDSPPLGQEHDKAGRIANSLALSDPAIRDKLESPPFSDQR